MRGAHCERLPAFSIVTGFIRTTMRAPPEKSRSAGTPFSPKRMNLRGAVRVPLPPSEIDRVGAELSEMRGGLSRRDVGVALVVAGLGSLTLAFT